MIAERIRVYGQEKIMIPRTVLFHVPRQINGRALGVGLTIPMTEMIVRLTKELFVEFDVCSSVPVESVCSHSSYGSYTVPSRSNVSDDTFETSVFVGFVNVRTFFFLFLCIRSACGEQLYNGITMTNKM